MDLLSTIRKTGSRGGVNFSWDEVANSSRRENYLGHSLKAPVGRWQRGKDLNWYAKADATAANANETQEEREARERKEELRKVKEAEEDAIARALGLPIKQRDTTGANSVEVADKRQIGPASGPEQAEQSATDGERRASEKSHRHRDEDGRDRDTRRRRRSRSRSPERNRDDGERRRHRSRSLDRGHRDRRQWSREKEDGHVKGERHGREDGHRREDGRHRKDRSRHRSRDRGGYRHRDDRLRRRSRSRSFEDRRVKRERSPRR
ncbi:hypothetical protein MY3296_000991 [Beauveria thailandica]